MGRKVEGYERFPGPSFHKPEHTATYQQPGDKAFKSPHAVPAVNMKPNGLRDNIPSSGDTYTGIPGDGVVGR